MLHKNIGVGEVHVMANWVVADATARGALTPAVSDVGKVCWQQDNDTFWVLKDDTPLTWAQLGGASSLSQLSDWPAGVSATEVGYLDGVTGAIQTQIDGKAASTHSHATGDITSLSEAIDDRVAALLVQGANVTLTYDDTANTLTIAATGGGSVAGSNTYVQYNDGGVMGAEAAFAYDKTTNTLSVDKIVLISGFSFTGPNNSAQTLYKYTGGTNNPGLYVKADEANDANALYSDGLLQLGGGSTANGIEIASNQITFNMPLKTTTGAIAAGKVLTSDASGNLTLQTPAAGGSTFASRFLLMGA